MGVIIAPKPFKVTGAPGATIAAGSFSYKNTTLIPQTIGGVILKVTDPAALASIILTFAATGQSATISPVGGSNTFAFIPPLTIPSGATESFMLSAVVSSTAARTRDSSMPACSAVVAGRRVADCC